MQRHCTNQKARSILYCQCPCSSSERTVRKMWVWGLWPSVSCMAASAHIPSDTNCSRIKSCRAQSAARSLARWATPRRTLWQACCPWPSRLPPRRSRAFPDSAIPTERIPAEISAARHAPVFSCSHAESHRNRYTGANNSDILDSLFSGYVVLRKQRC